MPHPALQSLLDRVHEARVLVAGDVMLDVYTVGTSTRMMPEAAHAPVLRVEDSQSCPGGAANVAANIAGLSGQCDLVCLTGNDPARECLLSLAAQGGIARDGFVIDETRPTIVKERVLSNGAHIVRLDREKTHDVTGVARDDLLARYESRLDGAGAVVLSDYNKGTLSDGVVRRMVDLAQALKIPVVIDSKRMDYSVFSGAYLAKPNMRELAERVGAFNHNDDHAVEQAARMLMADSGIENIMASRSEKGVMLVTKETAHHFPATARHVAEVSGGGDTMLAVAACLLALGADLQDAVWLANLGAGLAVEKPATAIVTAPELREAVKRFEQIEVAG